MKAKKPKKESKAKSEKREITKKFKEWTEAVKERDGWTCQLCGLKKGDIKDNGKPVVLNAHHIIGRDNKEFPDMRFDVENGITLCAGCHRFSKRGPHHGTFIFHEWLRRNFPSRYEYLTNVVFGVDK